MISVVLKEKQILREKDLGMGLEDKDFILRQVQELAEGIGKFLGKESIKELINYDQSQEDALTDEDIETILLISNIREIQQNKTLSDEEISRELGIAEKDLDDLYNNERSATSSELTALRNFVEENEIY
ncbi:hypothetical protein [Desemzia sp. RIT 804]|uniref:hypothetical protein n=1 Tax=Desemzia sp. RIT 804 TaxID=2810209 RepID=UPI001F18C7F8|nr:hypothetical protein [Desemzia sp. RIT 804]